MNEAHPLQIAFRPVVNQELGDALTFWRLKPDKLMDFEDHSPKLSNERCDSGIFLFDRIHSFIASLFSQPIIADLI